MSEQSIGSRRVASAPVGADLSEEIARTLPHAGHEQVTCRRVAPNHYRCNWWAPQNKSSYDNPAMAGMLVTTHRICRSRFLRVVKTDEGRLHMIGVEPGSDGREVFPGAVRAALTKAPAPQAAAVDDVPAE